MKQANQIVQKLQSADVSINIEAVKVIRSGFRNIDINIDLARGGNSNDSNNLPTKKFTGTLEINAVYFENYGEAKILMVSIDTLFIGNKFRLKVEEYFHDRLKPSEIFITASHTHSAPMIDFSKPKLGVPNQDFFDQVLEKTLDLCENLLQNQEVHPFKIQGYEYQSDIGIGRRKYRFIGEGRKRIIGFNQTFMLPNLREKVNQPTIVIRILKANGDSIVLWNQACHPVSTPDNHGHSPCYIGAGRNFFRNEFGSNTVVIFLQGFSGDIRPYSFGGIYSMKDFLRYIVFGRRFTVFNDEKYNKFINKLLKELEFAVVKINSNKVLSFNKLNSSREIRALSEFNIFCPDGDRYISKQLIDFGAMKITGMSAEVLSELSKPLKTNEGEFVLTVGCIDDVFGYLPDLKSLKKGGYEVDGYQPYFNISKVSIDSYIKIVTWLLEQ